MHAIYTEQLEYVWNVLRKLGVARSDVEDLTQDVFLRAFKDFDRYDQSRPLRPWLCGIAYHIAIDFFRRKGASPVAPGEPPEIASQLPAPEQQASKAQELKVLDRILQSLDLDKRTVLVMHELLGHTAAEIAQALEIPLNTAYSRLRLARVEFEAAVRQWRGEERR
jgi:RNA polymerase sigma-70 factor (ECF subfamily)